MLFYSIFVVILLKFSHDHWLVRHRSDWYNNDKYGKCATRMSSFTCNIFVDMFDPCHNIHQFTRYHSFSALGNLTQLESLNLSNESVELVPFHHHCETTCHSDIWICWMINYQFTGIISSNFAITNVTPAFGFGFQTNWVVPPFHPADTTPASGFAQFSTTDRHHSNRIVFLTWYNK